MNYQIYNEAMNMAIWYAKQQLESAQECAKLNGNNTFEGFHERTLRELEEAQKRMQAAVKVLKDEDSYEHDGNPIEQAMDLLAILGGGTDVT